MVKRTGQEIRLKQYPIGMPTEDMFEIVKVDIPEPKEGEFLVRNIWMSVRSLYARSDERTHKKLKAI